MNRTIIGFTLIVVFAVSIIVSGVHSAISVIEATAIEATAATAEPAAGEYVPRLASADEQDPALTALKYVCPFH